MTSDAYRSAHGGTTRYRVSHRTSYTYGVAVADAYTVACLLPREREFQEVLQSRVMTSPEPDEFVETRDVFGNRIVQLGVHHRHEAFEITAESIVDTTVQTVPSTSRSWEQVAEIARTLRGRRVDQGRAVPCRHEALDADRPNRPARRTRRPYLHPGSAGRRGRHRPVTGDLRGVRVRPDSDRLGTPLDTVLEKQRGVCQDFAHLATAVLRWVGLPASYVSGYIETDPPPGEVKSIGADASHAWCSVWTGPPDNDGGPARPSMPGSTSTRRTTRSHRLATSPSAGVATTPMSPPSAGSCSAPGRISCSTSPSTSPGSTSQN